MAKDKDSECTPQQFHFIFLIDAPCLSTDIAKFLEALVKWKGV